MLVAPMVEEVRRLLSCGGLSQRQIARQLGVGRGTVGAIASARRPDSRRRRPPDDEHPAPLAPPERCPGCGGRVYMPCVLCRVRRMRDEG